MHVSATATWSMLLAAVALALAVTLGLPAAGVAAEPADPDATADHPYDRDPTPELLPLQVDPTERFRVWDDPRSPHQRGERVVALTFDDGPHPTFTRQVLDVLDRYRVKGTFFVVGQTVRTHPSIVAETHARGHGVANHTFTHPSMTTLTDAQIRTETRSTHQAIVDATGRRPDCLRPPFGVRNQRVRDVLAAEGYASAMWSNDPRDWERPGTTAIVDRVLASLAPGDVIIFHDGPPGNDRSQTVAALPRIIEGIRSRGYRIVPFCHPSLATSRISGASRIDTAVQVSRRAHPGGARVAYLAVADNFPDALAGAPSAAADRAPILLTPTGGLPAATRAELQRLDPDEVVVLGGPGAISDTVAAQAGAAASARVTRLGGADRVGTAVTVSTRSHPGGAGVVYLAVAGNFPDALAGGAAAAAERAPILLTETNALPAATAQELARLNPSEVVVLGGPAAISQATADAAGRAGTASVTRLAGEDRYATARAIAQRSHPDRAGTVIVATGAAFPDALAGSAYAGATGAPVLLTAPDHIPAPTSGTLGRLRPDTALVVGGPAAVTDGVIRALERH